MENQSKTANLILALFLEIKLDFDLVSIHQQVFFKIGENSDLSKLPFFPPGILSRD